MMVARPSRDPAKRFKLSILLKRHNVQWVDPSESGARPSPPAARHRDHGTKVRTPPSTLADLHPDLHPEGVLKPSLEKSGKELVGASAGNDPRRFIDCAGCSGG